MASRKIDELATDIDDAKTTVDELADASDADRDDKLEELNKTLDHAKDAVDDLEKNDDE